VRDALARLAVGNRLWLVTHGSSALQRRKIQLAGIGTFFERIFISAEVALLKDDPLLAEFLARIAEDSDLTIRAVIGDGTSDLQLAAHGQWPAIHTCPRSPCEHSEPFVLHRRTVAHCSALE
jgi:phosphoglycolate phosphatase-like HAD superfamily hydrolase